MHWSQRSYSIARLQSDGLVMSGMVFHVERTRATEGSRQVENGRAASTDEDILDEHWKALERYPLKTKALTVEHSMQVGAVDLLERREGTVLLATSPGREGSDGPAGGVEEQAIQEDKQVIARITRLIDDSLAVSTVSKFRGTEITKIETNSNDLEDFMAKWISLWKPQLPVDPSEVSESVQEICSLEPFNKNHQTKIYEQAGTKDRAKILKAGIAKSPMDLLSGDAAKTVIGIKSKAKNKSKIQETGESMQRGSSNGLKVEHDQKATKAGELFGADKKGPSVSKASKSTRMKRIIHRRDKVALEPEAFGETGGAKLAVGPEKEQNNTVSDRSLSDTLNSFEGKKAPHRGRGRIWKRKVSVDKSTEKLQAAADSEKAGLLESSASIGGSKSDSDLNRTDKTARGFRRFWRPDKTKHGAAEKSDASIEHVDDESIKSVDGAPSSSKVQMKVSGPKGWGRLWKPDKVKIPTEEENRQQSSRVTVEASGSVDSASPSDLKMMPDKESTVEGSGWRLKWRGRDKHRRDKRRRDKDLQAATEEVSAVAEVEAKPDGEAKAEVQEGQTKTTLDSVGDEGPQIRMEGGSSPVFSEDTQGVAVDQQGSIEAVGVEKQTTEEDDEIVEKPQELEVAAAPSTDMLEEWKSRFYQEFISDIRGTIQSVIDRGLIKCSTRLDQLEGLIVDQAKAIAELPSKPFMETVVKEAVEESSEKFKREVATKAICIDETMKESKSSQAEASSYQKSVSEMPPTIDRSVGSDQAIVQHSGKQQGVEEFALGADALGTSKWPPSLSINKDDSEPTGSKGALLDLKKSAETLGGSQQGNQQGLLLRHPDEGQLAPEYNVKAQGESSLIIGQEISDGRKNGETYEPPPQGGQSVVYPRSPPPTAGLPFATGSMEASVGPINLSQSKSVNLLGQGNQFCQGVPPVQGSGPPPQCGCCNNTQVINANFEGYPATMVKRPTAIQEGLYGFEEASPKPCPRKLGNLVINDEEGITPARRIESFLPSPTQISHVNGSIVPDYHTAGKETPSLYNNHSLGKSSLFGPEVGRLANDEDMQPPAQAKKSAEESFSQIADSVGTVANGVRTRPSQVPRESRNPDGQAESPNLRGLDWLDLPSKGENFIQPIFSPIAKVNFIGGSMFDNNVGNGAAAPKSGVTRNESRPYQIGNFIQPILSPAANVTLSDASPTVDDPERFIDQDSTHHNISKQQPRNAQSGQRSSRNHSMVKAPRVTFNEQATTTEDLSADVETASLFDKKVGVPDQKLHGMHKEDCPQIKMSTSQEDVPPMARGTFAHAATMTDSDGRFNYEDPHEITTKLEKLKQNQDPSLKEKLMPSSKNDPMQTAATIDELHAIEKPSTGENYGPLQYQQRMNSLSFASGRETDSDAASVPDESKVHWSRIKDLRAMPFDDPGPIAIQLKIQRPVEKETFSHPVASSDDKSMVFPSFRVKFEEEATINYKSSTTYAEPVAGPANSISEGPGIGSPNDQETRMNHLSRSDNTLKSSTTDDARMPAEILDKNSQSKSETFNGGIPQPGKVPGWDLELIGNENLPLKKDKLMDDKPISKDASTATDNLTMPPAKGYEVTFVTFPKPLLN